MKFWIFLWRNSYFVIFGFYYWVLFLYFVKWVVGFLLFLVFFRRWMGLICVVGFFRARFICVFSFCFFLGNEINICLCFNVTVCKVFRRGYFMFYFFSIEYCFICCVVFFVMWKNVGRRLVFYVGVYSGISFFYLYGVIFGSLLGLLVLVVGVCVFVVF